MKYRVTRVVQVNFDFEVEAETPEKAAELTGGMMPDPCFELDHPEAHGGKVLVQATNTDQTVLVYDRNGNDEAVYMDP